MTGRHAPDLDRFLAKVLIRPDGCWYWLGYVDAVTGYARFRYEGKTGNTHKYSYQTFKGVKLPSGNKGTIDHLCRIRHCVNPSHLQYVPARVNIERSTNPKMALSLAGVCKNGHPATPENVYRRASTGHVVYCRLCRREKRAAARAVAVG